MFKPELLWLSFVRVQSESLAMELVQKLPAAALAGLIGTLSTADIARAVDATPPPKVCATSSLQSPPCAIVLDMLSCTRQQTFKQAYGYNVTTRQGELAGGARGSPVPSKGYSANREAMHNAGFRTVILHVY